MSTIVTLDQDQSSPEFAFFMILRFMQTEEEDVGIQYAQDLIREPGVSEELTLANSWHC